MRLPFIFSTTLGSLPANVPYFRANPSEVVSWAYKLPQADNLKIGLCWAGGARPHDPKANRIDKRRSLSLEAFRPVLEVEGTEFYSLQKGDGAGQTHPLLRDFTGAFHDFYDTAAFIQNLDLVITVDTSVAHLAGGLAKPVWMLSRFDGCWRWLMGRADSPWYPTMRIFRQEKPGDWSGTINNVTHALRERISRC
jgi:hypothetical protein